MEHRSEIQQLGDQVRKAIFISLSYWYVFVLSFVLVFAWSYYKNRYAQNVYSIYTTIFINKKGSAPEIYAGGISVTPRLNLENEIGILKSYQLNYEVISKLPFFETEYFRPRKFRYDKRLYKNTPFVVSYDSLNPPPAGKKYYVQIVDTNEIYVWEEKGQKQKTSLNTTVSISGHKFTIERNGAVNFEPGEYYFYRRNISSLVHSYSEKLRVDPRSPNSSILWIWIETTEPQKDIDYLNTLAEVYINKRVREKNEIALKTIEFIDQQLSVFSDSLRTTEDKLQVFKQKNLVDVSTASSELSEQLKDLDKQYKMLKIKKSFYIQLKKRLDTQPESAVVMSPSLVGIDDPTLESYLAELTKLIIDYKVLSSSSDNTDIPPVKQTKTQIEALKNTISVYLDQSIGFTEESMQELQNEISAIEKKLAELPEAERKWLQINRKFDINNEIYTFLMERRMEAGITLASSRPDAQVIDKARPETKRFKRKVGYVSYTKSLLIALFIPAMIIFLIVLLDNKIKTKDEIEAMTSLPIVGTITHNKYNADLPVAKYPRSSVAESFRALKTNIQFLTIDNPAKVILITSTISGEGKTFVATNLGAIYALSNKQVLLISADLRRPRIDRSFVAGNNTGITTYLSGENTIDEVIVKTEVDNLWLLPAGEIPPNPAELLESEKFVDLISKLKDKYDYIIIDTPPVGIVTDALILAVYADLFLYVVRQEYTTKSSIRLANEISEKDKLPKMALVVNDVKTSLVYGLKHGYSYSYGYGYGYSYGYGYYADEEELPQTKFGRWKYKIIRSVLNLFR